MAAGVERAEPRRDGIVADAAAGYAAAGYFTVVDGIVIPGWFLEPVRDALRDAGHGVDLAILRAPLSACLARVRQREGIPSIDLGAIERVWQGFAECGEFEANAIDLGDESPDEMAGLLARRLEGDSSPPEHDERLLRVPCDVEAEDDVRLDRIHDEVERGFDALRDIENGVSVFGSARVREGHRWYELGREVGACLARNGFTVITGGGPA